MSAREAFLDAVAGEVNDAMEEWDTGRVVDTTHPMATHVAQRLEKVGALRKTRTITTAEEVDALPDKTIVMTCYGNGVTIYRENVEIPAGHYHFLVEGGTSATVLHEPEPSGE